MFRSSDLGVELGLVLRLGLGMTKDSKQAIRVSVTQ